MYRAVDGVALRTKLKIRRAILLLSMLALSGCGMIVLNPQGPVGVREARLLGASALLMCVIVLPVIFIALFFAWKYRADAPHGDYAPNWRYSPRIDILVWTAPLVIVVLLTIANWRTTLALNPYKPYAVKAPLMVVDVVAMDWKWLFIYPAQGIATINEAAFPAGTQVDFRITSDSAMNVFFIPQLGSQIYAMSGMMTQDHLIAKNPGTYRGLSANFSGPGFSGMRFTAIATSAAGFADWVAKAKAAPGVLDDRTYQLMTGGDAYVPVGYFGHVKPGLFGDILASRGNMAKPMPAEATE